MNNNEEQTTITMSNTWFAMNNLTLTEIPLFEPEMEGGGIEE